MFSFFGFIIALIVIVVLIAVMVAIHTRFTNEILRLQKRVTHIEKYLQTHTKVVPVSTSTPKKVKKVVVKDAVVANTSTPVLPPCLHTTEHRFIAWLKEDWLMKLGAFLVILGVAWFLNYAFARNWIGVFGRVAVGLFAGAAVLIAGRMRMRTFVTQGGVLMFLGALIVTLTVFAARELYNMFTPLTALALIFLTASTLGVMGVVYKRAPLANANAFLVAIAPFLINAPHLSLTSLFTYLLVATVGALWVVAITGWRACCIFCIGGGVV